MTDLPTGNRPFSQPWRHQLKSAALNLGLVVGSLLFTFLLIETGLRLAYFGSLTWEHAYLLPLSPEPDPVMGWRYAPNGVAKKEKLDYHLVVKTNNHGLMDSDTEYAKPAGRFRIVLLGDSYMEASQVAREDGLPTLLEGLLGLSVEVVNLGVADFGTVQEYLYLREEGIKYKPDLVLLGFYPENDGHNNSRRLSGMLWGTENKRYYCRPYATALPSPPFLKIEAPEYARARRDYEAILAQYSPFWYRLDVATQSVAVDTWKVLTRSLKPRIFAGDEDPNIHLGIYLNKYDSSLTPREGVDEQTYKDAWAESWAITEEALKATNDLSREQGAKFALFTVPSKIQTEVEYCARLQSMYPQLTLKPELPTEKLSAIAKGMGVPFCALDEPMRAAYEANGKALTYTIDDAHWNPHGHRVAAEALAKWLQEQYLVPTN